MYSYTYAGAIIGTGLGLTVAARGRANMLRTVQRMQNAPKPAEVIMQDGKHGQFGTLSLSRLT